MDLRERTTSSTQRHPWERARLRAVDALVREHAAAGPLLDVGAGDGFVARHFARDHDVVAVDANYVDADVAALEREHLTASTTLPARSDFAVALLLDVIEHVDDDVALLRDARACLRDDGIAVVTVPAWPALFSSHDTFLQHRRRYTPSTLHAALQAAGLRVVVDGGLFSSLLLPRALAVVAERFRTPSSNGVGGFHAPRVVDDVITAVLDVDARLGRLLRLPGLSLFAVVQR